MVELIAERERVEPGETLYAAIKMELDDGWHVYWRNAGDAGLPPEVRVLDGSDVTEDLDQAAREVVEHMPGIVAAANCAL